MVKKRNFTMFVIFLLLLIIDLVVPDPIPIIDELLLAIISGYYFKESW